MFLNPRRAQGLELLSRLSLVYVTNPLTPSISSRAEQSPGQLFLSFHTSQDLAPVPHLGAPSSIAIRSPKKVGPRMGMGASSRMLDVGCWNQVLSSRILSGLRGRAGLRSVTRAMILLVSSLETEHSRAAVPTLSIAMASWRPNMPYKYARPERYQPGQTTCST